VRKQKKKKKQKKQNQIKSIFYFFQFFFFYLSRRKIRTLHNYLLIETKHNSVFKKRMSIKDEEGYIVSFDIESETKEILNFFDEYGFVCIKDVLTKEDCEDTVQDIFKYVESSDWKKSYIQDLDENFKTSIKINDKSTWDK
jgi:hypothetical protein